MKLIFTSIFIICYSLLQAQITKVHFELEAADNLYHCYLVVLDGETTGTRTRLQSSSQITFVLPTGSTIDNIIGHMPIVNNGDYKGSKPTTWKVSNKIKNPISTPGYDYLSIVPDLSPFSFYNDLKSGDKIKLFSLEITIPEKGDKRVRMFNNILDPKSNAPGMGGGNFSNGITIGSTQQLYEEFLKP